MYFSSVDISHMTDLICETFNFDLTECIKIAVPQHDGCLFEQQVESGIMANNSWLTHIPSKLSDNITYSV